MNYTECQSHWENLIDKYDYEGYDKLTSDERIWFNVRSLIDEVDNGGLISFYSNHGADYLEETIEDLKKLEAQEIINLIDQINSLFPNSMPSRDIDERNNIISSWDDDDNDLNDLLESLDEKFYALEEELELRLEPIVRRIISLVD
jgi:hypothetical protein